MNASAVLLYSPAQL